MFAGGGDVALPGARRAHVGEQRLERLDRAGPPAKFGERRDAAFGDVVVQFTMYNRLRIVATAVHQIKVRTGSQKLADDAERHVPGHCRGHQERRHAAPGRPGVHRGPVLHEQTNHALVTHRGGGLGVGDRPMIRQSTPVVRQHGAMERRVPAPERTTRGGPVAQQDADGVHRADPGRAAQNPLLDAGARRAEELGDGRARRPTRHAGVREERRARGLSVPFGRVGRAARREPLPDHLDPALARGERDLVLRNRPPSGTAFGGAALCVGSTATGQESAAGQREATREPKWELLHGHLDQVELLHRHERRARRPRRRLVHRYRCQRHERRAGRPRRRLVHRYGCQAPRPRPWVGLFDLDPAYP